MIRRGIVEAVSEAGASGRTTNSVYLSGINTAKGKKKKCNSVLTTRGLGARARAID